MVDTLWYENDEGERFPAPDPAGEDPFAVPKGATIQVSRFPCELRTLYLGLNEDGTSTRVAEFTSSWSEDLVTAMVIAGEPLGASIVRAAESCERCMNVLAHDFGLAWGYSCDSEEYDRCGTECAACGGK